MTVNNLKFYCNWDCYNKHLKPEVWSLADKVAYVATSLFPLLALVRLVKYLAQGLANRLILPAAYYMTQKRKELSKKYFNWYWAAVSAPFKVERHTVVTPDGAELSAVLLRHPKATQKTSTIISFNPNFAIADEMAIYSWIVEEAIKSGKVANFVFFDYRGTGDSKGRFTCPRDLTIDGASIVQWIKTISSPEKIHFLGTSLGGAVALKAQALDPALTGRNLNYVSFSSLEKVVESFVGNGLIARFAKWALEDPNYEMNAGEAFKKAQGEKLILSHPFDRIIKESASLQKEVNHDHSISLEPVDPWKQSSRDCHHNAPMEWFPRALEESAAFLFG